MTFFKVNPIIAAQAFHITPVSANVKTGPIPVTTSTRESCSPTCDFFGNGCYAESGPLRIHWNAVTAGLRGMSFDAFCEAIASFEPETFWRMNQAGDLPHIGGYIDSGAMHRLIEANSGLRGFTYTHHDITIPENLEIVELANISGFTVNLSANNVEHADALYQTGLPVCVVLPIDTEENFVSPAGNKIVVCPATIRENVSCATCQLCARVDRNIIIGFPAHGTGQKKADSVARKIIPIKSI